MVRHFPASSPLSFQNANSQNPVLQQTTGRSYSGHPESPWGILSQSTILYILDCQAFLGRHQGLDNQLVLQQGIDLQVCLSHFSWHCATGHSYLSQCLPHASGTSSWNLYPSSIAVLEKRVLTNKMLRHWYAYASFCVSVETNCTSGGNLIVKSPFWVNTAIA